MRKKLLALAVCLSLALTGCSAVSESVQEGITEGLEAAQKAAEETAQENSEAEAEVSEEEETAEVTPVKLGKAVNIGDWKVTASKVQTKNKIPYSSYMVYKPSKGSTFLCVSLKVQNKGKKEDTFLPRVGYENEDNFATLYFEDYEYQPSALTSYDKDLLDESIKPLTKKNGIICFEVPKKVAKKKGKLTLKIGTTENYTIYKFK